MSFRNFANPKIVVQDWYVACPSRSLPEKKIHAFELGTQKLLAYRDQSGIVHVIESRCPHLGADLSMGKVIGDRIQCLFHNWEIGPDGICKHAPALAYVPDRRCRSYPAVEKWGLVWFFNGSKAGHPLPEIDPLLEKRKLVFPAKYIKAHPHLVLGNGLDAAHMFPLHGLQLDQGPVFSTSAPHQLRISFTAHYTGLLQRWLSGSRKEHIKAAFHTHGASIAFAEIQHPIQSLTLFTGRPDSKGFCHTQTVIFLQTRRPAYVIQAISSIYFLLKDDNRLLNRLDFRPAFTEQDCYMEAYARLLEDMEIY